MRIHFASAERPKSVARKLRKLLKERGEPITQHRSLEIVASLYGYRDWQELSSSIGSHAASPEDHAVLPEIASARRKAQVAALVRHGIGQRDAVTFLDGLGKPAAPLQGHRHATRILDSMIERAVAMGVVAIEIESRRDDYRVRYVGAGAGTSHSGPLEDLPDLLRMVEDRAFEAHRTRDPRSSAFAMYGASAYRLDKAKLPTGQGGDVEVRVIHSDAMDTPRDPSTQELKRGVMDRFMHGEPELGLLDSILRDAFRVGASDIHIEPREGSYSVHFRVIGHRTLARSGSPEEFQEILSSVKRRSGLDDDVDRVGQDGRFKASYKDEPVDLRVATIPSRDGEIIVLRVLDPTRVRPSLSGLGLVIVKAGEWNASLRRRGGLGLIVGHGADVRREALNLSIRELERAGRKVFKASAPMEYRVPFTVSKGTDPGFPEDFGDFMRPDPDVLIMEEVRDPETANMAIEASRSGHLVIATLHEDSIFDLTGIDDGVVKAIKAQEAIRYFGRPWQPPTWVDPPLPPYLLDLVMDVGSVIAPRAAMILSQPDGSLKLGSAVETIDLTQDEHSAFMRGFVDDPDQMQLTKVSRDDGLLTLRVQWFRDFRNLAFRSLFVRGNDWKADTDRIEALLDRNPSPAMRKAIEEALAASNASAPSL